MSATIRPLTPGGITADWTFGMAALSSLVLFLAAFTFRRKAIDRAEGILFLAAYALYLWQLIR